VRRKRTRRKAGLDRELAEIRATVEDLGGNRGEDPLTDEEREVRDRCQSSFSAFIREAWRFVSPQPFIPTWHVSTIAERLQALAEREIENLLILIPPGQAKSLVGACIYPAWTWTREPSEQFLAASHAQNLATRDTLRSRNIIQSEWYQRLWPAAELVSDQNTKTRFANTAGGWRIATSVGSQVTGERGSQIIIDDLLDLKSAYYPAKVAAALTHYREVLSTRGVGVATRKLITMQRVAWKDLASEVLEMAEEEGGEDFDTLILPMRYDPAFQMVLPSGITYGPDERDERRPGGAHEGEELLSPDLYPERTVRQLEISLQDRADAILQLAPQEGQGLMFRKSTFGYFYVAEEGDLQGGIARLGDPGYYFKTPRGPRAYNDLKCTKFVTVDLAVSQKASADYFVAQVWALTPGGHMLLLDQERGRFTAPEQLGILWRIHGTCRPYAVYIESTGYQLSLVQTLRAEGMSEVEELKAKGDKRERAAVAAKLLALGRVYFRGDLGADYLEELEDEVTSFPLGEHDDQVDALAYAAILIDSQEVTPAVEDEYAILEQRAELERVRSQHSGDRPPTPEEWLATNTPDKGSYMVNVGAARGLGPFHGSPWGEIPRHFPGLPDTERYRL